SGADEEKRKLAVGQAELGACRGTQRGAVARMEMLEVYAVMDDVELLGRDPEGSADVLAHHRGIADHGAQRRMLEHAALFGADVGVIRVERDAEALERARRRAPDFEPARVHAVAGPVEVAAGNTLVGLDEIEFARPPGVPRRVGEGPVAPRIADM